MVDLDLEKLEKLLCDERREVKVIDSQVHKIQEELVERTPTKFASKDIARSFFGALVVAFGFVLKGAMVKTAVRMDGGHVIAIIIFSIIALIFEIYYFGYRKIKNKHNRKPFQFIMKRLPTFYLISILVSTGLIFLYGVNNNALIMNQTDVIRVIVSVSLPASIGAGFSDLLKKY